MIEDMRQRSRVYSIVLARVLPTHAQEPATTLSHLLPTRRHARTRTRTRTSVCTAAGLAGHRGAQLRAPPRCAACVTALCHSATGNSAGCNMQPARMDKRQQATRRGRYATCNRRLATHNVQQMRCDVGPGDRQPTPCDVGHWDGQQTTCNGERATGDRQQTTGNVQQTTDNVQQARSNGQRATDGTQETTCKRPLENANQTTCDGEHATGKMQQKTRRMQHTTARQHARCMRAIRSE